MAIIGLYALYIIGLLYSKDIHEALYSMEKRASLVILPIAICSITTIKIKSVINILSVFFFSLTITCVIIYVGAFMEYYSSNAEISLTYFINEYKREKLSGFSLLQYHHPYLGLFIATGILFIVTYFSKFHFKILYGLAGCFLFLFLIQLEAKMSLIALLLTLLVYVAILLKNYSYKLFVGFVLTVLLVSGGIYLIKPTVVKTKIGHIIYADGGSRIRNWESAYMAIKQAPIIGHGPGDNLSVLQSQRPKGSWEREEKYNAHNEYLDITISFGLMGLLYWLCVLVHIIRKSYMQGHYFFCLFTILFSLCGLTDVLLNRFAGVALFALIISTFANVSESSNTKASNTL